MTGAKVLRLRPPSGASRRAHVPFVVQAAPGSVAVVLPATEPGESAHRLSPDEAYELGLSLLAAARDGARQGRRTTRG